MTVTPHDMVAFLVMQLLALSAGIAVRLRRDEVERAAALASSSGDEHARQLRSDLAAERRRIARELHTIVTRDLSTIAQLAQAARWNLGGAKGPLEGVDPPPDAVAAGGDPQAALGSIAHVTTNALEELRRVLRVLRADERPGVAASAAAFATPPLAVAAAERRRWRERRAGWGELVAGRIGDVVCAVLALGVLAIEQVTHDGRAVGWISGVGLIVLPLLLMRSRAPGFATA